MGILLLLASVQVLSVTLHGSAAVDASGAVTTANLRIDSPDDADQNRKNVVNKFAHRRRGLRAQDDQTDEIYGFMDLGMGAGKELMDERMVVIRAFGQVIDVLKLIGNTQVPKMRDLVEYSTEDRSKIVNDMATAIPQWIDEFTNQAKLTEEENNEGRKDLQDHIYWARGERNALSGELRKEGVEITSFLRQNFGDSTGKFDRQIRKMGTEGEEMLRKYEVKLMKLKQSLSNRLTTITTSMDGTNLKVLDASKKNEEVVEKKLHKYDENAMNLFSKGKREGKEVMRTDAKLKATEKKEVGRILGGDKENADELKRWINATRDELLHTIGQMGKEYTQSWEGIQHTIDDYDHTTIDAVKKVKDYVQNQLLSVRRPLASSRGILERALADHNRDGMELALLAKGTAKTVELGDKENTKRYAAAKEQATSTGSEFDRSISDAIDEMKDTVTRLAEGETARRGKMMETAEALTAGVEKWAKNRADRATEKFDTQYDKTLGNIDNLETEVKDSVRKAEMGQESLDKYVEKSHENLDEGEESLDKLVDSSAKTVDKALNSSLSYVTEAEAAGSEGLVSLQTNLGSHNNELLNAWNAELSQVVKSGQSLQQGQNSAVGAQFSKLNGKLSAYEKTHVENGVVAVVKNLNIKIDAAKADVTGLKGKIADGIAYTKDEEKKVKTELALEAVSANGAAQSKEGTFKKELGTELVAVNGDLTNQTAGQKQLLDTMVTELDTRINTAEGLSQQEISAVNTKIADRSTQVNAAQAKVENTLEHGLQDASKVINGDLDEARDKRAHWYDDEQAKIKSAVVDEQKKSDEEIIVAEKNEHDTREKMEVDGDNKANRIDADLKHQLNKIDQKLDVATTDQRGHLATLKTAIKGLETRLESDKEKQQDTRTEMQRGFDDVANTLGSVWDKVEVGSKEATQVLEDHKKSLQKVVDRTTNVVSDKAKELIDGTVKALHEKMDDIVADVNLTAEERNKKLKEIQAVALDKIAAIALEDQKLVPFATGYAKNFKVAQQEEAELVGALSKGVSDLKSGEQKDADALAAAQKQDDKTMLTKVTGGIHSMESSINKVKDVANGVVADGEADGAMVAGEVSAAEGSISGALSQAAAEKAKAEQLGRKTSQEGAAALDEISNALADVDEHDTMDIVHVKEGMKEHFKEAQQSQLGDQMQRQKLIAEIGTILSLAQGVSTRVVQERMEGVGQMQKEMQTSIDKLKDAGHGELAKMMEKTLAFSKQLLQSMVDMKKAMYYDTQMEDDAKHSEATMKEKFGAMRQKLLDSAMQSADQTAKLEHALKGQLAALGVTGQEASDHLAMFLNQLVFQLASGEQHGFENLLGKMFDTFGISVHDIEGIDSILGGATRALDMKQKALIDLLRRTNGTLQGTRTQFEAFRERALDSMGDEHQFASMSDKSLREQLLSLKKTLGLVAIKEDHKDQQELARLEKDAARKAEEAAQAAAEAEAQKNAQIDAAAEEALALVKTTTTTTAGGNEPKAKPAWYSLVEKGSGGALQDRFAHLEARMHKDRERRAANKDAQAQIAEKLHASLSVFKDLHESHKRNR